MVRSDRQQLTGRSLEETRQLAHGREAYEARAWNDAYRSLSRAGEAVALATDDLERLATAAYLTGRDEEYLRVLERTHHAYLDAGKRRRAARSAFWLGLRLAFRGEMAPATGWFARAHRLLEREPRDCVEQGYLMQPRVERHLAEGDLDAAYAVASGAVEIGERCADADLVACARHLQGRVLLRQRRPEEGFALLDEAMVFVTASDRLSLLVLSDSLGLAPFQPTPEFGSALMNFLRQPDEDTHDALWARCAFDLDRLREGMGASWDSLRAYNLDRARVPEMKPVQQSLMEQLGLPAIPPEDLARISAPTVLIWGRHDLATQLAVAEAASARFGWPLHVIENTADDPPIEQPEAFLHALHPALSDLSAKGSARA